MHKQMMKKLMACVMTMALSCSVFMGTSIESNATSVSGNEVTNEETVVEEGTQGTETVSENEIPEENTGSSDGAVSTSELSSGSTSSYIGVSELGWDTNEPWVAKFKINDATPGIYSMELYFNGNSVMSYDYGDLSYLNGQYFYNNINTELKDTGDYTFQVKISEDDNDGIFDFTTGCVSAVSGAFHYERPATAVGTVTNLRWDSEREGIAKWDPVENAIGYRIWLYNGEHMVIGYYNYDSAVMESDFLDKMSDSGEYRFKVQAISKDVLQYANGEWSDFSGYYGVDDTKKEEVTDILDSSATTAAEKVSSLTTNITKDTLQALIQTETEIQNKIEELETAYRMEKGIQQPDPVVDPSLMNPNDVKIVGASLNASSAGTVNFNIAVPTDEEKAAISQELPLHKSVLTFEMGLTGAGIDSNNLAIPVCITLPVPEGMNPYNLRVAHRSTVTGNTVIYDSSNIRLSDDKKTFSFTIDHFSTFAILEVEPSQSGGTGAIQSVVSSSNGVQQIVSSSNWVPTTPDEKKRYAVMGKEPVECVPAATNTYAVSVRNSMQGPKCFASFEAVLGDYTIGRTYNIFPENKAVYTMNGAAKITLNIPSVLRKDGREFKMICVTENGTPYILNDLDKDPNTITFETDKFYAFALIYK